MAGRLARFFRERPGQWIDGRVLSGIGGFYAYRTRISDLRRAPFDLQIDNRQRRIRRSDGSTVVVSEYRYAPASLFGAAGDLQEDADESAPTLPPAA